MCSTKCERPLSSLASNRAPTLTKSAQTAVWRWGSATVVTARPLSSVVVSTAGSSTEEAYHVVSKGRSDAPQKDRDRGRRRLHRAHGEHGAGGRGLFVPASQGRRRGA